VRLAGLPVSLLKLGATALLYLLRLGPVLQTVSRDLELNIEVGQRGKRALQLRQEVIWVERGFDYPRCWGRLCRSGI